MLPKDAFRAMSAREENIISVQLALERASDSTIPRRKEERRGKGSKGKTEEWEWQGGR